MFIIKPKDQKDWAEALFMLSYYHVVINVFSNGENADDMYIRVEDESYCCQEASEGRKAEEQLRLAEMAFQANWHQSLGICEQCYDENIEVCVVCDIRYSCDDSRGDCQLKNQPVSCGHLTFTEPIKGAF